MYALYMCMYKACMYGRVDWELEVRDHRGLVRLMGLAGLVVRRYRGSAASRR